MMEPHATVAVWNGDELTVWTSNQMVDWGRSDLALTLGIPKHKVRLVSPFVGGGFGGKLFLRSDVVLAALGARAARRPVKLALQRALVINNTTHRPATIQRVRIGATRDGRITAIGHESWSGDLPQGKPDGAVHQTRMLYAGANRMTATRFAVLDLPRGQRDACARRSDRTHGPRNRDGRTGGKARPRSLWSSESATTRRWFPTTAGHKLPTTRRHSSRRAQRTMPNPRATHFRSDSWWNACAWVPSDSAGKNAMRGRHRPAMAAGWSGMGMASAYRGAPVTKSAARVRLDSRGAITVETDMTDIGTGSYTIIAQTAAEMMGVPLASVFVRLGDSNFPVSAGSGRGSGAPPAPPPACMRPV
jgi:xanthine dehydrogenase YagR molybdenum-binding subunit